MISIFYCYIFFFQGTPLHATINKYLIPQFRELIQEGNLYIIKNIKVVATNETYIQDSESIISRHYFEFVTVEIIS